MSKFNPFDPANGYSEEDRVALETKCASLINRAYRNPFPGASLRHDGADNAGIFFAKQLAHIKTKAYDSRCCWLYRYAGSEECRLLDGRPGLYLRL